MGHFAVALICGYLIGSIPTAYIIVRLFTKQDIRLSGSGSVGAANTFKVTKSGSLGIIVAVFDIVKGTVAYFVGLYIGGGDFIFAAIAGVFAVAGHNFSIWLRLKGGRGLATAAGFLFPWMWSAPVVWAVIWGIARKLTGNTHISNVIATGIILIFVLAAKNEWLISLTSDVAQPGDVRIAMFMLCGLIYIKHIEPIIMKRPGGME